MRDWAFIVAKAKEIVLSYDTPVTLRQLFYRLVAAEVLPNTHVAYSTLSSRTAEARRQGWFPKLIDRTRRIHKYPSFEGPDQAKSWLKDIYRRDRTEGQEKVVYLAVEKAGIVEQLRIWFEPLGVPILALGGYSSQTYVDEVMEDVREDGRESVILYAGDFDPSGEDIDRDFLERTGCFTDVHRVALTPEQVTRYNLPPQMGKATDPRAEGFIRKHGVLVQVELDALPPDTLHSLYQQVLRTYWDPDAYKDVLTQEEEERSKL